MANSDPQLRAVGNTGGLIEPVTGPPGEGRPAGDHGSASPGLCCFGSLRQAPHSPSAPFHLEILSLLAAETQLPHLKHTCSATFPRTGFGQYSGGCGLAAWGAAGGAKRLGGLGSTRMPGNRGLSIKALPLAELRHERGSGRSSGYFLAFRRKGKGKGGLGWLLGLLVFCQSKSSCT